MLYSLRELTDINIYQASYKPDTLSREENNGNVDVKRSHLDTKSQLHQLALFDRGLKELKSYLESRLAVADLLSKPIPRIVHLAREYGFSSRECDLFNLMVVAQGSNNAHVLNSLTEEDYMRKVSFIFVDILCFSANC